MSEYPSEWECDVVLSDGTTAHVRPIVANDRSRRHAISRLITGNSDPNCATFGYGSIEELTAFVDRTLG